LRDTERHKITMQEIINGLWPGSSPPLILLKLKDKYFINYLLTLII
jgi:hypothetical protein